MVSKPTCKRTKSFEKTGRHISQRKIGSFCGCSSSNVSLHWQHHSSTSIQQWNGSDCICCWANGRCWNDTYGRQSSCNIWNGISATFNDDPFTIWHIYEIWIKILMGYLTDGHEYSFFRKAYSFSKHVVLSEIIEMIIQLIVKLVMDKRDSFEVRYQW